MNYAKRKSHHLPISSSLLVYSRRRLCRRMELINKLNGRVNNFHNLNKTMPNNQLYNVVQQAIQASFRQEIQPMLNSTDFQKDNIWLSTEDASRLIGTSQKTIRRWIDQGTIKASKVGARWRIKKDDIKNMIESNAGKTKIMNEDQEAKRIIEQRRKIASSSLPIAIRASAELESKRALFFSNSFRVDAIAWDDISNIARSALSYSKTAFSFNPLHLVNKTHINESGRKKNLRFKKKS